MCREGYNLQADILSQSNTPRIGEIEYIVYTTPRIGEIEYIVYNTPRIGEIEYIVYNTPHKGEIQSTLSTPHLA